MTWFISKISDPAGAVWSGAPQYNITAGVSSQPVLPVTSTGEPISVSWLEPGNLPNWISFQSGNPPKIIFTGSQLDSNDITGVKLRATVGSGYVDSEYGWINVSGNTSTWNITNFTLTDAQGSTFSVASTGPNGYKTGGIYQVDPSGNPLPSGLTLDTSNGLVTNVSNTVGTYPGVVLSYSEPGAMPTLTLHGSGTNVPYMATVYPLEGVVPAGYTLGSDSDANLVGSILSTWEDGSAKVMVLAGQTTVITSKPLPLKVITPTGTDLTTQKIKDAVSTIKANFGFGEQTLTLASATEDFIWWKNPQVICARYRLGCGSGSLEAVIDIHAFAGGRAFVEVVVENGKLNPASPVAPANQTYTAATIKVNDVEITPVGGVSSSAAPTGVHQPFRAWYCSGWVGGDPSIEVTHDTTSMQMHPLFYKPYTSTSLDLQTLYQNDNYTPWSIGRHSTSMGAGGDSNSGPIGPITGWEARYLQNGNRYARRAVLASALGLHTFNFQYRDQSTNLPMSTSTALTSGKSLGAGTFPGVGGNPFANRTYASWDYAHQPSVGLMAFLCRPSPCFIELAQKIAVFNAIGANSGGVSTRAGLLSGDFEGRGKAWGFRNISQATFLTPDSQTTLKTALKTNLSKNINYFLLWDDSTEDKLNYLWTTSVSYLYDWGPYFQNIWTVTDMQQPVWYHHFVAAETYKAYNAKILTGTDQTALGRFVDWALLQPVRWVNEQPNGGWRYIGYVTSCGTSAGSSYSSMGQLSDWGIQRAYTISGAPPSVSGTWYSGGQDYSTYTNPGWFVENGNSGYYYVEPFWAALCSAVERGVTGADTAWNTVTTDANTKVTNLSTFLSNANGSPKYICYPRNK